MNTPKPADTEPIFSSCEPAGSAQEPSGLTCTPSLGTVLLAKQLATDWNVVHDAIGSFADLHAEL